MPDKEEIICEMCHEREATHHICFGGTGVSKNLCGQCYEKSAMPEELATNEWVNDSIRSGSCSYCGEPAAGGSGSFSAFLGRKLFLWCENCRQDMVEFYSMPENALTPEFPFNDKTVLEESMKHAAELNQRLEEFMRQKIAERKKGN